MTSPQIESIAARAARRLVGAALGGLLLAIAGPAPAQVTVSVVGNQAFAQISLPNGLDTVGADVAITFDSPVNLSPAELNLSAQVVDPNDATLIARLPACSPACVLIDPAFPLLITIEPLDVPWLFHSGFDDPADDGGLLGFLNTYEIEIHAHNIDCVAPDVGQTCPTTAYRLFKAPLGSTSPFADYTDDVVKGSVRARGRDGAFSQFLIVADTRPSSTVEPDKALALEARIVAANIGATLQNDLLGKLAQVQVDALDNADYAAAITELDALIAEVEANAGTAIANRWSADHSVVNDAGEIEGLAQTLRYTLGRLQQGN